MKKTLAFLHALILLLIFLPISTLAVSTEEIPPLSAFKFAIYEDIVNDTESNNFVDEAQTIKSTQTVVGNLQFSDAFKERNPQAADMDYVDADMFRFTLNARSHCIFMMVPQDHTTDDYMMLTLSDEEDKPLEGGSSIPSAADSYGEFSCMGDVTLDAGTYHATVFSKIRDIKYSEARYVFYFEAISLDGTDTSVQEPLVEGVPGEKKEPNFYRSSTYVEGQFQDVKDTDWYASSVKDAYEFGLMKGQSDAAFSPNETLTVGETIALAARIHHIFQGGDGTFEQSVPWYQVYVDYAFENGIIYSADMNWGNNITRADFATYIKNAVPIEQLPTINDIADGDIPDLPMDSYSTPAVYALYRAGVLTGGDKYGSFSPNNTIDRASVSAIVSRIAAPGTRKAFDLAPMPIYPESLAVTGKSAYYIGDSFQLAVNYYPETTSVRDVNWSSSNAGIATVSGEGYVTALKTGTTNIIVKSINGVQAEYPITVLKREGIKIHDVSVDINSVGGAEPTIIWKNTSGKIIKYVTFTMVPYNEVGDVVSCRISGERAVQGEITGPIEPFEMGREQPLSAKYKPAPFIHAPSPQYAEWFDSLEYTVSKDSSGQYYITDSYLDISERKVVYCYIDLTEDDYNKVYTEVSSWDPLWYNYSIFEVRISKVSIEYMDGTTETISNPQIWNDSVTTPWTKGYNSR